MKISHEVPISLLEESKNFNDYDYCLVHLLDKYPKYEEYFMNSDREIILDNSAYELGDAYDDNIFIEKIKQMKPTWYILPDTMNNYESTINRSIEFNKKFDIHNGYSEPMAVVQGKTIEEFTDCYNEYVNIGIKKIAFNFISDLYLTPFNNNKISHFNIHEKRMLGRYIILKYMFTNVVDHSLEHHLLGCNLPQAGIRYKRNDIFKSITSIDTSNPIIHGYLNLVYNKSLGLNMKKSLAIEDILEEKIDLSTYNNIMWNVKIFRGFWND